MKKPTSFNFLLSSVLFIVLTFTLNAQLQNANWYFGKGAALNFNDGTEPTIALTGGILSTAGASATLSDASGNLLFYTDGIRVWNKEHEIIKSWDPMYGSETVSQSVLIVPQPKDKSKYYIFTNQGQEPGSNGLSHSLVRMNNDGTLGELTDKNKPLLPYTSEKLTTIYNQVENSYWVVSFAPSSDPAHSDTFYSFKVINDKIILSNQSTFSFLPEAVDYPGGQMKISPDGTTLAMVHNTVDQKGPSNGVENVFSFDFNMLTGAVTSMKSYALENTLYCYGLEFSPDSDKFLVSSTHRLSDGASDNLMHQIWYRNAEALYIPDQIIGFTEEPVYSLQMAMDGNIYGTSYVSSGLHCFSNPNGLSQEVCFDAYAIDLNGRYSFKGLPQLVPDQLVPYDPQGGNRSTDTKYTIMENPFEEDLEIKFHFKGEYTLKLYNLSGTMLINVNIKISEVDKIKEIDTEDLIDGVYMLTIIDQDHNNEEYSETVVKLDDYH